MNFPAVILAFGLISAVAHAAPGRSPAVEDFVGIEVSETESLPQGKESLVHLEQDMQQLEKIEAAAYVADTQPSKEHATKEQTPFEWNSFNISVAVAFFLLPLLSWYMAVSHLRKKAMVESASNVEVLAKYRRERELARKKEEEYRKVS